MTLAFSLIAFIIYYSKRGKSINQLLLLEVGSYDLINGEEKLVEPVSSLIKKLKINQISKNSNTVKF